jgi:two-component system response regulator LytT
MYKVCLCDDDDVFREQLKNKISRIATKHQLKLSILEFSSGQSMVFELENAGEDIDIFFMDVLMPGLTGIEAAQKLREWENRAQIVFFTSSKEHVFEAFDVMPLHYLIKQEASEEMVEKILLKAVAMAEKNRNQSFVYKVGHTVKRVCLKDIVYFEIKNRVVHMYCMDDRQEEFYQTMEKLERELQDKNFVRVHRSYLVNLANIHSLETKQITCLNRMCVPMGEKYLEQVRKEYSRFILEETEIL